jgi:hypothetical protein
VRPQDDPNGGWVSQLRSEPLKSLDLPEPGKASALDLARAYGSIVFGWLKQWPLVVEGLQWLHGGVLDAKAAAISAREEAAGARYEAAGARAATQQLFELLERRGLLPLSAMRREFPSSHALAESVGHAVRRDFEEQTNNPSTPPVGPEDIQKMVEERVQVVLTANRVATLEKAEADRLALLKESRQARTKVLIALVAAGVAAVGGVTTALIEHFSR